MRNQYQAYKIWNKYNPNDKINKKDGFVIHHIDENPSNNKIDNLCKLSISEHIKHHHLNKKRPDSTRYKMSISKKGIVIGDKNNFYGKKHSLESKIKMSKSHKNKYCGKENPFYGKHHSEETKKKISNIHKGKIISEEQRKIVSEKLKGRIPWNKNKKKSKEGEYVYR